MVIKKKKTFSFKVEELDWKWFKKHWIAFIKPSEHLKKEKLKKEKTESLASLMQNI